MNLSGDIGRKSGFSYESKRYFAPGKQVYFQRRSGGKFLVLSLRRGVFVRETPSDFLTLVAQASLRVCGVEEGRGARYGFRV